MIMIIDGNEDDIVDSNGSENNDNNSNIHDGSTTDVQSISA